MDAAHGPPDAEWFRQMANGGAVVFFILRVQPDVAFEFITDAIESQLGCPAAEGLADPAAVLSLVEPECGDQLAALLTLPPGSETTSEMTWRHRDGRPFYARAWVRSRRREDGSVILEGSIRDVTRLHETEAELRQSEELHRLLAENAWEVIWTMAMDTTITYVSPAVQHARGLTPEEAMNQSLVEALTPESVQIALGYFQQLFDAVEAGSELPMFRGEVEFYRKDKSVMSADLQVIPHVDENGQIIELLGVSRDISERKKVEAELRQSEERYRLLADNAWEIVWTADMDGNPTYCSSGVERLRGFTVDEVMNQRLEDIYSPDSAARIGGYFRRLHAAVRDGTEPPVFREEHEQYRADGSIMITEMQVIPHLDDDGRVVEIIGVTRDISERKRFEAELRRLAVTDPVTGVWNRRHGEELLAAEMNDARATGRPLSLLMLDIDHFKSVNDRHGHQAGDHVLIEISSRLHDSLNRTDAVARWGGEEFVVLLRGCHIDDAVATAEKIRTRIADSPFDGAGSATVSIGAAELAAEDDLDSWLAHADEALYKAKRSGRNAVRAY